MANSCISRIPSYSSSSARKTTATPRDKTATNGFKLNATSVHFVVCGACSCRGVTGPVGIPGPELHCCRVCGLLQRLSFSFEFADAGLKRLQVVSIHFDQRPIPHLAMARNNSSRAKARGFLEAA